MKSHTRKTPKNKPQRRQLDPVFKQVLTEEFMPFQATLQTEVEVSRLPRTVDAVITIAEESERQRIQEETPFFYMLPANQIEFKGRRDPLTSDDLHMIHARKHLLVRERKILPRQTAVTIVCASKPVAALAYASAELEQPFTSLGEGYYRCAGLPVIYIIVANELPLIAKNYPLLLFAASEHKFREVLAQVVTQGKTTYLRYAYEIRPQVTREVLTMSGMSATLSKEDLKFMAEDVGPELMPYLPPETRMAGLPPETRMAGLPPETRMAGLPPEARMAGLPPEARMAGMSIGDVLKVLASDPNVTELNGEQRKMLLELLQKLQTSDKKSNGSHLQ